MLLRVLPDRTVPPRSLRAISSSSEHQAATSAKMANDAMDKIESIIPFCEKKKTRCYELVALYADHPNRSERLQEVVQDLYVLSVQVHAYQGPETTEAMIYQM